MVRAWRSVIRLLIVRVQSLLGAGFQKDIRVLPFQHWVIVTMLALHSPQVLYTST